MGLGDNWRQVLRRAWSVRFIALAALLTGTEAVALVLGVDWLPVPDVWRAGGLFMLSVAALVARITAQKGVS